MAARIEDLGTETSVRTSFVCHEHHASGPASTYRPLSEIAVVLSDKKSPINGFPLRDTKDPVKCLQGAICGRTTPDYHSTHAYSENKGWSCWQCGDIRESKRILRIRVSIGDEDLIASMRATSAKDSSNQFLPLNDIPWPPTVPCFSEYHRTH
ncbi:hypothetical protein Tco_0356688 [Tanacetum coccineum]